MTLISFFCVANALAFFPCFNLHKILVKFLSCCILLAVVATADEKEAFTDIDVAILVGAMPRKDGMERKDLLKANAKIFESQGKALDQFAKKSVKVS